jgi:hypothetical protein
VRARDEAANIIKTFADTLTPERAARLLNAPTIADILTFGR